MPGADVIFLMTKSVRRSAGYVVFRILLASVLTICLRCFANSSGSSTDSGQSVPLKDNSPLTLDSVVSTTDPTVLTLDNTNLTLGSTNFTLDSTDLTLPRSHTPTSERTVSRMSGAGVGEVKSTGLSAQRTHTDTMYTHSGTTFGRYGKTDAVSKNEYTRGVEVGTTDDTDEEVPFVEKVLLSPQRLRTCVRQNGHLTVFTNILQLIWTQSGDEEEEGPQEDRSARRCRLKVSTTPNMSFVVDLWAGNNQKCSALNYLVLSSGEKTMTWYHSCDDKATSHFTTVSNTLLVDLHQGDSSYDDSYAVNFFAKVLRLEVKHLSPTQVLVQTAGHDMDMRYSAQMDTWTEVIPPRDHVTLVSVGRLHVQPSCGDFVELYAGSRGVEDRVWGPLCGTEPPPPRLLRAPVLHVHFTSNIWEQLTGFKMLFSHHPPSRVPSRLTGGLWNCSVTWWPEFERHFRCNLEKECGGGEDEVSCYYSGVCGPGFLTLNNRCYMYVRPDNQLSWVAANIDCVSKGGYLASLNSPEEWSAVTEVLKLRANPAEIFVGLRRLDSSLPPMYMYGWQWADGSVAFYLKAFGSTSANCGQFSDSVDNLNLNFPCNRLKTCTYLCEMDSSAHEGEGWRQEKPPRPVQFVTPDTAVTSFPVIGCPRGHVTHAFLACDPSSACWQSAYRHGDHDVWGVPSPASCPANMTSLPAMLACRSGVQHVPYSMVCDHQQQCDDGSDEEFCVFPPCTPSRPLRCATSVQCVVADAYCDGQDQCSNHDDESDCQMNSFYVEMDSAPPPAIVHFHRRGLWKDGQPYSIRPVNHWGLHSGQEFRCPETHFRCAGEGYCLPVFARCNGVVDCPGGEDETSCSTLTCPAFYRCRGSGVCLHSDYICDGVHHCPQQDDETFCGLTCHEQCTCHGLAFTCQEPFPAGLYPELRYLNGEGSGMSVDQLLLNVMLVHLGLARCRVGRIQNLTFPNLRSLDLGENLISSLTVEQLRGVPNLQVLSLAANPLKQLAPSTSLAHASLHTLDVSNTTLSEIDLSSLASFSQLSKLNLSRTSSLRRLHQSGNETAARLNVLDLRGCHVTDLQPEVVSSLGDLHTLFAEDYKLCCPAVLPPDFNVKTCWAPDDALSSCDSLLASTELRVCIWISCSVALVANSLGLVIRTFVQRGSNCPGMEVYVSHLSLSDLVMGASVAVLAAAERLYRGSYVLNDANWRRSVACTVVRSLSFLAYQVSVYVLFFLILDGVACLRGRSGQRLVTKARVACAAVWFISVVLTLCVTLTGQDLSGHAAALCLLLPVSGTRHFPNHHAFQAVVVFHVVLAALSAVGQLVIYVITRRQKHLSSPTELSARRRVSVLSSVSVVSWWTVCALAILSWRGTPVSAKAEITVVILSAPCLAAFRPCAYALGYFQEKRRRERMERLMAYCRRQAKG